MDVDATVQDLLTKCWRKWHSQTTKQHHFSWRFLESVKNQVRGDRPSHSWWTCKNCDDCLVRDSMLKDNLQEEFNKYPQPKNYKRLTKVCVNQLIWDNLSASIQSQDLRFQKYKHLFWRAWQHSLASLMPSWKIFWSGFATLCIWLWNLTWSLCGWQGGIEKLN